MSDHAPPVQGLWIGDNLSVLEQLCISSFLHNGHDFHLYVYTDMAGVPEGTTIRDANEILPETSIFEYKRHPSVAAFSNTFRYKLLHEHGGYWVDMDVVCLKPFRFDDGHAFVRVPQRSRLGPLSGRSHISTWFIKAPPGSEVMSYCYEDAIARDQETMEWGDTGAQLLSKAVGELGAEDSVVPHGTFVPFYWWHWRRLVDGSTISNLRWRLASRSAVAVHMYNEMWRRNGVEKNGIFPEDSVYESLKRRYLGGH